MADNTSDAQLDFLLQVLKATAESRSDQQVVYPLLAANTDKLDDRLAELLRAWATIKLAEVEADQAKSIAAVIGNFSNIIQKFPLGDKASNIEIAITGYEVILTVFTREAFPENWAMTQHLLGAAYYDRIKEEKAKNIEEAIACLQQALRVRTFEAFPYEWARTQNNLGAAYCDRIKGEKAQNIEDAIAFYQQALRVYTFEAFPYEWASTQNNLGAAYCDRIKGEKAQNIEDAIACYQQALRVTTFEAFPIAWAETQNNLGNAYGDRIKGEKLQNIEDAIVCYQQAIKVYTFETFTEKWAITQNNLGIAYADRIKGEKAQNLEEAIACYQEALRVYTFEAFPVNWAITQNNLGIAYRDRIKGEKAQNIEEAIACYQEALRVYTFEAFTQAWAITQSNLGVAYCYRIKGEKAQNIEDAIACHQQALKVYTFEAFPEDWAITQNNLGVAYRNRITGEKAENIQKAYTTFKSVLETVEYLRSEIISGDETKRKHAEEWNRTYINIVETCLDLTNITEAIEYVERSKTRNLLEKILSRDLKTILPIDVATQLEQYRDEIAIGQYQIQHSKADNPTALAQHLQQLRQQRNELQNHYLPISSGFEFEQFRKTLDKNTAIVEFYISFDRFLTFIFTRHSQQPLVLSSSTDELDALIDWTTAYLADYYQPQDWRNQLTSRLQKLAEILNLKKILQQLPKDCNQLILIPHWYLHLFPLHALPLPENQGKWLLNRFSQGVRYSPNCQLLQLAKTRKRPKEFTHLFAVQNPTADLVYTTIEVDVIKRYFNPPPDTEVLVENAATKAAIDSKALNTFHCAHFSCHGYFNYQEPRKSALILANAHKPASAESNPERYLRVSEEEVFDLEKCLTIDEVFGLQLEQCRLVTLSACETGLIDFNNTSDEYIGLPSGFLVAGSPAVVSSLWMVNDLSTALLMIKFYQNLREKMSLAVALNQAQFWLRDSTQSELLAWSRQLPLDNSSMKKIEQALDWFNPDEQPFQNPYYWAAFCVIGE
ncbi:CHAT domain-containing protein [Moorena sp. SIO3H5]|uniref:CHAT domain-containing protein n=1 Tax=Moorena sp. SIO3H5 TaxID=2607834 RepID=UPI0025CB7A5B|nr:CHAT domain-containing protein [Moorena sp. SIO3H5]